MANEENMNHSPQPGSDKPMTDQAIDQPPSTEKKNWFGREVDPSQEDTYWRENYSSKPYHTADLVENPDLDYERDYNPAYKLGYTHRVNYPPETSFNEAESDLSSKWEEFKGESRLKWEQAKHAVKDAWERLTK